MTTTMTKVRSAETEREYQAALARLARGCSELGDSVWLMLGPAPKVSK